MVRSRILLVLCVVLGVTLFGCSTGSTGTTATNAPSSDHGPPSSNLVTPATGTSLTSPARGSVFLCLQQGFLTKPTDRPWINGGLIELSKRPNVTGAATSPSSFTATLTGSSRDLKGNGLPNHPTGQFPVQMGTAAYQWYAGLPASGYANAAEIPIKPWDLSLSVPRYPTVDAKPTCISKLTTGIARSGAPFHLEVAFDSENHLIDPNAALPLDSCFGHPYAAQYHYHGPSYGCITGQASGDCRKTQDSPIVGWAIDGLGVYGPCEHGKPVTNQELDECHGRTSFVWRDGQWVSVYHYVLNNEYPYSIGCFRGTPVSLPSQFS